ncbi:TPA: amino acid adenylation domain-containing protein [Legionella feeleii]
MKRKTANTLHEMFEMQVKQRPQKIAAIFERQAISYAQLNQRANQLAHYLRTLGVTAETQVALCMNRSIDFLIAIMAILKAGGAYIPLDPSSPEERLLLILHEGSTSILITTSEWKTKLSRYQGKTILFNEDEELCKQSLDNLQSVTSPHHLAYIIYTSGSTGKPKGVLIEHEGVVNYAKWFADSCTLNTQQLVDFSSNPSFDFALTTSLVPLTIGLTVVICEDKVKKDPGLYLNYLVTSKVSFIKITPSYFRVLLHQLKIKCRPLHHLKKVMLAGENLAASDCAAWLSFYPKHRLFNEYGPTETSVAVCLYQIDSKNISSLEANVPIGRLVPNCQSYLLDENGLPVADGEIGELYLGGCCLARGYLNNTTLTERYFIKDPFNNAPNARLYKTGDLCRRLPEGELECIGRIDHQIKIRGFRVEPAEIEHCLSAHHQLKSAAVITADGYRKEKILVAYYILNDKNQAVSDNELRQYLKQYLPDFMIPSCFVSIESFPLNANDKLDTLALPAPSFTPTIGQVAPQTPLEKILAEIWSEELGIKPIGIHDDFFDLGGHSLSAARIITTINHALGKEISLQNFYQKPTIAAVASMLDQLQEVRQQTDSYAETYKDKNQLPLSDFQFTLWLSNTFESKAKKLNICARERVQGMLDLEKLKTALALIIKKHETLCYRIFSFRPVQSLQKNLPPEIAVKNLASLPEKESEIVLETSFNELRALYPWPKNQPLIMVRLFYLKGRNTEIQLCMPHIISDHVSPAILFSDLSNFYLSAQSPSLNRDTRYREYIFKEQAYTQTYFNRDFMFWEDYLEDASLFTFPAEYVVANMKKSQIPYSTYTEISQEALQNLRLFCAHNHISLNDGLSSVILLALRNCCGCKLNAHSSICMTKVKSTRDDHNYDKTIGCFLELELIKAQINKQSTLSSVCREVHASIMATSPYQKCSNIVKLASIGTFREPKKIKEYGVKLLTWLYSCLFPKLQLNRKILNCCGRLNSFKGNNFLININMHTDFLTSEKENTSLFGLKAKNLNNYQYDLLEVDNFLDICFLRMTDNRPHMAISANLTTDFRERLAKEILRIMKEDTKQYYPKDQSMFCG